MAYFHHKKLPHVLDFSQAKSVDLSDIDLSGVREIKWPKERVGGLRKETLPEHLRKSYDLWQAKMRVKAKSKDASQESDPNNIPHRNTSNEY